MPTWFSSDFKPLSFGVPVSVNIMSPRAERRMYYGENEIIMACYKASFIQVK